MDGIYKIIDKIFYKLFKFITDRLFFIRLRVCQWRVKFEMYKMVIKHEYIPENYYFVRLNELLKRRRHGDKKEK